MRAMKSIAGLWLALLLTACQSVPYDYTELMRSAPRSIVVIPPINNSIEVDAPYVFLSTLDVRNPDPTILGTLVVALLVVCFRPARKHLSKMMTEFRSARLIDLFLWNLFLTLLLLEVGLAFTDWATQHP